MTNWPEYARTVKRDVWGPPVPSTYWHGRRVKPSPSPELAAWLAER